MRAAPRSKSRTNPVDMFKIDIFLVSDSEFDNFALYNHLKSTYYISDIFSPLCFSESGM